MGSSSRTVCTTRTRRTGGRATSTAGSTSLSCSDATTGSSTPSEEKQNLRKNASGGAIHCGVSAGSLPMGSKGFKLGAGCRHATARGALGPSHPRRVDSLPQGARHIGAPRPFRPGFAGAGVGWGLVDQSLDGLGDEVDVDGLELREGAGLGARREHLRAAHLHRCANSSCQKCSSHSRRVGGVRGGGRAHRRRPCVAGRAPR